MTPFETKLAKIKDRAEAATPGPWRQQFFIVVGTTPDDDGEFKAITSNRVTLENANFIASARTDVPALIAALRRVIEQRDYYMSEYHSTRKQEEKCDHELAKILEGGK